MCTCFVPWRNDSDNFLLSATQKIPVRESLKWESLAFFQLGDFLSATPAETTHTSNTSARQLEDISQPKEQKFFSKEDFKSPWLHTRTPRSFCFSGLTSNSAFLVNWESPNVTVLITFPFAVFFFMAQKGKSTRSPLFCCLMGGKM